MAGSGKPGIEVVPTEIEVKYGNVNSARNCSLLGFLLIVDTHVLFV